MKQELLLEAAPIAMLIVATDGRIVSANSRAALLFGYSQEELLSFNINVLVSRRYLNSKTGLLADTMAMSGSISGGPGREVYGLHSDGTEVAIEIGLNPMMTSTGMVVVASIVDVTERARADERFHAVVEASPSAMMMVSADGRITMVNSQVEKLFGYRRSELLGYPVDMLLPAEMRQAHAALRKGFMANPEARPMGAGRDLYGVRRDGSKFPIEIGLSPIETREGKFTLASIIEITERKREHDLLQAALAEKVTLLKEIHHRVKNNLQVIVSLLSMQAGITSDVAALHVLEQSQQRVYSMALIHEMLYGSDNLDRLDLADYARRLTGELIPAHSAGNVELIVDAEPTVLTIHKAVPCGLILNELVLNSLKHAFPQGRPGRILVSIGTNDDGMAHLSVEDDGAGLPREFDWRESRSLGLKIVGILAAQLDGKLTVTREPTKFAVTFPMKASRAAGA